MLTVLEVGANHGEDTARFALDPNARIFAFEPTPDLFAQLQRRFSNSDNVFIVPMAVDNDQGWAWFNICRSDIGGVSSLYEFNKASTDVYEEKSGKKLTHSERFRVMKCRLDNFIEINRLGRIDYLWIDAQGNDFKVLQSLGDKIDIVVQGKCEAAYTHNIYAGSDNNHVVITQWLKDKGFEVAVVPDAGMMEADIHFKKK